MLAYLSDMQGLEFLGMLVASDFDWLHRMRHEEQCDFAEDLAELQEHLVRPGEGGRLFNSVQELIRWS